MRVIRIGTRGSALALTQTEHIIELATPYSQDTTFATHVIHTTGDVDLTTPLSELGGKGVFIRELESALLYGEVDAAMHSLKDVTVALAPGLALCAFLEPESRLDALVLASHLVGPSFENPFDALPYGAVVGTGSLRRKAWLRHIRPDLTILPIRGNVDTRLSRLDDDCDAVILSQAGLIRLGLVGPHIISLSPKLFCPAPGQGVICVQVREDDEDMRAVFSAITHPVIQRCAQFEFGILERLFFNCQIPFGLLISPTETGYEAITWLSDSTLTSIWKKECQFAIYDSDIAITQLGDQIVEQAKRWGWVA